jgi:hypothetical protein
MHSVESLPRRRHSVGSEIVTVAGRERVKEERDRQKKKDRSRDAERMQLKACSDATIQSVATSTQKEEDGIGLHCY